MHDLNARLSLAAGIGSLILLGSDVYLLSYAPFLALAPNSYSIAYRAPVIYRPAEWTILRTPLQTVLLEWAEWHGVGHTTEMQVFYFADGVSNPADEINWNIASP